MLQSEFETPKRAAREWQGPLLPRVKQPDASISTTTVFYPLHSTTSNQTMVYIDNIKSDVTLVDARTRLPIHPASDPVCHSQAFDAKMYNDGYYGQESMVTVPVKVSYGQEFYFNIENRNPEASDDEPISETDFKVIIRMTHLSRRNDKPVVEALIGSGSTQAIYGVDCSRRSSFRFPGHSRHLRFFNGVSGKITIEIIIGSIPTLPLASREDDPQDSDDDVSEWGDHPCFDIGENLNRSKVVFEYELSQPEDPVQRSKLRRKRRAALELLRPKIKPMSKTMAGLLRAKRGRPPTKLRLSLPEAGHHADGSQPAPEGHILSPTRPSRESSIDDMYWTPRSSASSPGPSGTQDEGNISGAIQHTSEVLPQPQPSHPASIPSSSQHLGTAMSPARLGAAPLYDDEVVEVKPPLPSPASSSSSSPVVRSDNARAAALASEYQQITEKLRFFDGVLEDKIRQEARLTFLVDTKSGNSTFADKQELLKVQNSIRVYKQDIKDAQDRQTQLFLEKQGLQRRPADSEPQKSEVVDLTMDDDV
ncbi:hypothetical protein EIP91_008433 [Steccherinum ochraceum]|uniref:Uncharacterized protein n=1 Tax=Steccherinum ochraceum TaxID=92696 RepID=A0A4R0R8I4_9APHY|nr:hypothetical protein EIP91_008433 [Steccherinum ochraceum]